MTRVEIYDQDRNERAMYMDAKIDEEIELPLTRDGLEALLERAASIYSLPVDDRMRQVLCGYIHHVENEKNTITVLQISKMLHKSICNSLSWMVDQEIKKKEREAALKLVQDPDKKSDVTPINQA